ncbi:MAG: hypothetical protein HYT97_10115 [Elusimicrobia bacterium]|nr:hypothetical protein [Elusimicrobiota bacterium]
MTIQFWIEKRNRNWLQITAGLVVISFLFTTVSAPFAQANLWNERKKAREELASKRTEGTRETRETSSDKTITSQPHLELASLAGVSLPASTLGSFNSQISPEALQQVLTKIQTQPKSSTNKNSFGIPSEFLTQIESYGELERVYLKKGNHLQVVEGKLKSGTGPLVFLIQDAHGIYGVQKNIALLLKELTTLGAGIVGVEGAEGRIRGLDQYRNYPNKETLNGMAGYLMKKGLLTGVEVAGLAKTAVSSGRDHETYEISGNVEFFGVEEQETYLEQVKSFKDTLKDEKQVRDWVLEMSRTIGDLKAKNYSAELKELDRNKEMYEQGEINLGEWLEYLNGIRSSEIEIHQGLSQKGNRDLRGSGLLNIDRYLSAYRLEKSIDFKKVSEEQKKLLEHLSNKLNPQELTELLKESIAYRLGKIGYGEFYAGIEQRCEKAKLKITPELKKYMNYVAGVEGIEREKLFVELKELEEDVSDRVVNGYENKGSKVVSKKEGTWMSITATGINGDVGERKTKGNVVNRADGADEADEADKGNVGERKNRRTKEVRKNIEELILIDKDYRLLKKAVDFKLSPEEWEEYNKRENEIIKIRGRLEGFDRRVNREQTIQPEELDAKITLEQTIQPLDHSVSEILKNVSRFNKLSHERNQIFVNKLLARMEKAESEKSSRDNLGSSISILIAGGYHSKGVEELLKKKGISFITIRPEMNASELQKDYHPLNAFKRDLLPLEKMFLPEKVTLAPPLALANMESLKGKTVQGILNGMVVLDAANGKGGMRALLKKDEKIGELFTGVVDNIRFATSKTEDIKGLRSDLENAGLGDEFEYGETVPMGTNGKVIPFASKKEKPSVLARAALLIKTDAAKYKARRIVQFLRRGSKRIYTASGEFVEQRIISPISAVLDENTNDERPHEIPSGDVNQDSGEMTKDQKVEDDKIGPSHPLNPKKRNIFLIGEEHGDAEEDAFTTVLREIAENQKLVLGLEGIPADNPSFAEFLINQIFQAKKGSLIFGYENHFAYQFSRLIIEIVKTIERILGLLDLETLIMPSKGLIDSLRYHKAFGIRAPLISYWERIDEDALSVAARKIFKRIKRYIATVPSVTTYLDLPWEDIPYIKAIWMKDDDMYGYLQLLTYLLLEMLPDVRLQINVIRDKGEETEKVQIEGIIKELHILITNFFKSKATARENMMYLISPYTNIEGLLKELIDLVVVKWRDSLIFGNMTKIADYATEHGLNVFFVVGYGHISGLSHYFRVHGYQEQLKAVYRSSSHLLEEFGTIQNAMKSSGSITVMSKDKSLKSSVFTGLALSGLAFGLALLGNYFLSLDDLNWVLMAVPCLISGGFHLTQALVILIAAIRAGLNKGPADESRLIPEFRNLPSEQKNLKSFLTPCQFKDGKIHVNPRIMQFIPKGMQKVFYQHEENHRTFENNRAEFERAHPKLSNLSKVPGLEEFIVSMQDFHRIFKKLLSPILTFFLLSPLLTGSAGELIFQCIELLAVASGAIVIFRETIMHSLISFVLERDRFKLGSLAESSLNKKSSGKDVEGKECMTVEYDPNDSNDKIATFLQKKGIKGSHYIDYGGRYIIFIEKGSPEEESLQFKFEVIRIHRFNISDHLRDGDEDEKGDFPESARRLIYIVTLAELAIGEGWEQVEDSPFALKFLNRLNLAELRKICLFEKDDEDWIRANANLPFSPTKLSAHMKEFNLFFNSLRQQVAKIYMERKFGKHRSLANLARFFLTKKNVIDESDIALKAEFLIDKYGVDRVLSMVEEMIREESKKGGILGDIEVGTVIKMGDGSEKSLTSQLLAEILKENLASSLNLRNQTLNKTPTAQDELNSDSIQQNLEDTDRMVLFKLPEGTPKWMVDIYEIGIAPHWESWGLALFKGALSLFVTSAILLIVYNFGLGETYFSFASYETPQNIPFWTFAFVVADGIVGAFITSLFKEQHTKIGQDVRAGPWIAHGLAWLFSSGVSFALSFGLVPSSLEDFRNIIGSHIGMNYTSDFLTIMLIGIIVYGIVHTVYHIIWNFNHESKNRMSFVSAAIDEVDVKKDGTKSRVSKIPAVNHPQWHGYKIIFSKEFYDDISRHQNLQANIANAMLPNLSRRLSQPKSLMKGLAQGKDLLGVFRIKNGDRRLYFSFDPEKKIVRLLAFKIKAEMADGKGITKPEALKHIAEINADHNKTIRDRQQVSELMDLLFSSTPQDITPQRLDGLLEFIEDDEHYLERVEGSLLIPLQKARSAAEMANLIQSLESIEDESPLSVLELTMELEQDARKENKTLNDFVNDSQVPAETKQKMSRFLGGFTIDWAKVTSHVREIVEDEFKNEKSDTESLNYLYSYFKLVGAESVSNGIEKQLEQWIKSVDPVYSINSLMGILQNKYKIGRDHAAKESKAIVQLVLSKENGERATALAEHLREKFHVKNGEALGHAKEIVFQMDWTRGMVPALERIMKVLALDFASAVEYLERVLNQITLNKLVEVQSRYFVDKKGMTPQQARDRALSVLSQDDSGNAEVQLPPEMAVLANDVLGRFGSQLNFSFADVFWIVLETESVLPKAMEGNADGAVLDLALVLNSKFSERLNAESAIELAAFSVNRAVLVKGCGSFIEDIQRKLNLKSRQAFKKAFELVNQKLKISELEPPQNEEYPTSDEIVDLAGLLGRLFKITNHDAETIAKNLSSAYHQKNLNEKDIVSLIGQSLGKHRKNHALQKEEFSQILDQITLTDSLFRMFIYLRNRNREEITNSFDRFSLIAEILQTLYDHSFESKEEIIEPKILAVAETSPSEAPLVEKREIVAEPPLATEEVMQDTEERGREIQNLERASLHALENGDIRQSLMSVMNGSVWYERYFAPFSNSLIYGGLVAIFSISVAVGILALMGISMEQTKAIIIGTPVFLGALYFYDTILDTFLSLRYRKMAKQIRVQPGLKILKTFLTRMIYSTALTMAGLAYFFSSSPYHLLTLLFSYSAFYILIQVFYRLSHNLTTSPPITIAIFEAKDYQVFSKENKTISEISALIQKNGSYTIGDQIFSIEEVQGLRTRTATKWLIKGRKFKAMIMDGSGDVNKGRTQAAELAFNLIQRIQSGESLMLLLYRLQTSNDLELSLDSLRAPEIDSVEISSAKDFMKKLEELAKDHSLSTAVQLSLVYQMYLGKLLRFELYSDVRRLEDMAYRKILGDHFEAARMLIPRGTSKQDENNFRRVLIELHSSLSHLVQFADHGQHVQQYAQTYDLEDLKETLTRGLDIPVMLAIREFREEIQLMAAKLNVDMAELIKLSNEYYKSNLWKYADEFRSNPNPAMYLLLILVSLEKDFHRENSDTAIYLKETEQLKEELIQKRMLSASQLMDEAQKIVADARKHFEVSPEYQVPYSDKGGFLQMAVAGYKTGVVKGEKDSKWGRIFYVGADQIPFEDFARRNGLKIVSQGGSVYHLTDKKNEPVIIMDGPDFATVLGSKKIALQLAQAAALLAQEQDKADNKSFINSLAVGVFLGVVLAGVAHFGIPQFGNFSEMLAFFLVGGFYFRQSIAILIAAIRAGLNKGPTGKRIINKSKIILKFSSLPKAQRNLKSFLTPCKVIHGKIYFNPRLMQFISPEMQELFYQHEKNHLAFELAHPKLSKVLLLGEFFVSLKDFQLAFSREETRAELFKDLLFFIFVFSIGAASLHLNVLLSSILQAISNTSEEFRQGMGAVIIAAIVVLPRFVRFVNHKVRFEKGMLEVKRLIRDKRYLDAQPLPNKFRANAISLKELYRLSKIYSAIGSGLRSEESKIEFPEQSKESFEKAIQLAKIYLRKKNPGKESSFIREKSFEFLVDSLVSSGMAQLVLREVSYEPLQYQFESYAVIGSRLYYLKKDLPVTEMIFKTALRKALTTAEPNPYRRILERMYSSGNNSPENKSECFTYLQNLIDRIDIPDDHIIKAAFFYDTGNSIGEAVVGFAMAEELAVKIPDLMDRSRYYDLLAATMFRLSGTEEVYYTRTSAGKTEVEVVRNSGQYFRSQAERIASLRLPEYIEKTSIPFYENMQEAAKLKSYSVKKKSLLARTLMAPLFILGMVGMGSDSDGGGWQAARVDEDSRRMRVKQLFSQSNSEGKVNFNTESNSSSIIEQPDGSLRMDYEGQTILFKAIEAHALPGVLSIYKFLKLFPALLKDKSPLLFVLPESFGLRMNTLLSSVAETIDFNDYLLAFMGEERPKNRLGTITEGTIQESLDWLTSNPDITQGRPIVFFFNSISNKSKQVLSWILEHPEYAEKIYFVVGSYSFCGEIWDYARLIARSRGRKSIKRDIKLEFDILSKVFLSLMNIAPETIQSNGKAKGNSFSNVFVNAAKGASSNTQLELFPKNVQEILRNQDGQSMVEGNIIMAVLAGIVVSAFAWNEAVPFLIEFTFRFTTIMVAAMTLFFIFEHSGSLVLNGLGLYALSFALTGAAGSDVDLSFWLSAGGSLLLAGLIGWGLIYLWNHKNSSGDREVEMDSSKSKDRSSSFSRRLLIGVAIFMIGLAGTLGAAPFFIREIKQMIHPTHGQLTYSFEFHALDTKDPFLQKVKEAAKNHDKVFIVLEQAPPSFVDIASYLQQFPNDTRLLTNIESLDDPQMQESLEKLLSGFQPISQDLLSKEWEAGKKDVPAHFVPLYDYAFQNPGKVHLVVEKSPLESFKAQLKSEIFNSQIRHAFYLESNEELAFDLMNNFYKQLALQIQYRDQALSLTVQQLMRDYPYDALFVRRGLAHEGIIEIVGENPKFQIQNITSINPNQFRGIPMVPALEKYSKELLSGKSIPKTERKLFLSFIPYQALYSNMADIHGLKIETLRAISELFEHMTPGDLEKLTQDVQQAYKIMNARRVGYGDTSPGKELDLFILAWLKENKFLPLEIEEQLKPEIKALPISRLKDIIDYLNRHGSNLDSISETSSTPSSLQKVNIESVSAQDLQTGSLINKFALGFFAAVKIGIPRGIKAIFAAVKRFLGLAVLSTIPVLLGMGGVPSDGGARASEIEKHQRQLREYGEKYGLEGMEDQLIHGLKPTGMYAIGSIMYRINKHEGRLKINYNDFIAFMNRMHKGGSEQHRERLINAEDPVAQLYLFLMSLSRDLGEQNLTPDEFLEDVNRIRDTLASISTQQLVEQAKEFALQIKDQVSTKAFLPTGLVLYLLESHSEEESNVLVNHLMKLEEEGYEEIVIVLEQMPPPPMALKAYEDYFGTSMSNPDYLSDPSFQEKLETFLKEKWWTIIERNVDELRKGKKGGIHPPIILYLGKNPNIKVISEKAPFETALAMLRSYEAYLKAERALYEQGDGDEFEFIQGMNRWAEEHWKSSKGRNPALAQLVNEIKDAHPRAAIVVNIGYGHSSVIDLVGSDDKFKTEVKSLIPEEYTTHANLILESYIENGGSIPSTLRKILLGAPVYNLILTGFRREKRQRLETITHLNKMFETMDETVLDELTKDIIKHSKVLRKNGNWSAYAFYSILHWLHDKGILLPELFSKLDPRMQQIFKSFKFSEYMAQIVRDLPSEAPSNMGSF